MAGAAHSTTGSVPSHTTCTPCRTAPVACAGKETAGAATDEDVEGFTGACLCVRARRVEVGLV
jgi:hypothetical protein